MREKTHGPSAGSGKKCIRVLMLHHAFPPLGGKAGCCVRDLLKRIAQEEDIHLDFVSISDSHIYQSESLGDRVVTHRLNVYKGKPKGITAADLYEYQAKCYIFILRTSQKIQYDAIHAVGLFPESYTAYAFRSRFPFCLSLLPTDEAVADLMTGGNSKALKSLRKEFIRASFAVFDHNTPGSSKWINPARAAETYLTAYRTLKKFERQPV